ncbi:site-specific integrase [Janthinobacterium lividum]|uniref:site-specific integrase n=1 Tax=Janthinobacterium lividum TaxID=29581 RepID=UPI001594EDA4|nr:site-specific integrase [Janthinobacterium lividum]QKY12039.1 site-specific integrase [Janthinobacterium lividum]
MNADYVAASIEMIKRVMSGQTYEQVGDAYSLRQTAVQHRVKMIARDLQSIVGVVGVADHAIPTAMMLREHRQAYLEALEHYTPERAGYSRLRKCAVPDEQVDMLAQQIRQHSRNAKRDVALLMILFSTAAKPLEIARLEVRDYLAPDGSVRMQSSIRADVAISGRERPVYFCCDAVNMAVDQYLAERFARQHGIGETPHFRGLAPSSKLFLRPDGENMRILQKSKHNGKQYLCSDILLAYKRIFSFAPFVGMTAMSARRTIAQKLDTCGVACAAIGTLLGVSERAAVRRLLSGHPGRHTKGVGMRDDVHLRHQA